jgi:hypothetical protein
MGAVINSSLVKVYSDHEGCCQIQDFIVPSFCDHTSTSIGMLLFRPNALCRTEDFVVHDRHDISLDDTKSQEVYRSHCHWAGDNLIYLTY